MNTQVHAMFSQSVHEARVQAGLNLGAKVFAYGGTIAETGNAICDAYARSEPPTPEQISALRNAAREVLAAIAVYGVAGAGGGRD